MKEEKWKTVEDKKGASNSAHKKALALLLKSVNPIDAIEYRVTKMVPHSAARRCIGVPMCDYSNACNTHRHIRLR